MTFNEISTIAAFKANVFIDWLNVKANGGQGLDFFKLMSLIREKGSILFRAAIYVPEPEDEKIRNFYDAMKKAGLKLIYIVVERKPRNENEPNINNDILVS